jgi:hypothetical protein
VTLADAIDTLRDFAKRHRATYGTTCHAISVVLAAIENGPTGGIGQRAGQLTLDIVDHLKKESDGAVVLTAIGAAVVVELDRFERTIDEFSASLKKLKTGRDAELARQKREN